MYSYVCVNNKSYIKLCTRRRTHWTNVLTGLPQTILGLWNSISSQLNVAAPASQGKNSKTLQKYKGNKNQFLWIGKGILNTEVIQPVFESYMLYYLDGRK